MKKERIKKPISYKAQVYEAILEEITTHKMNSDQIYSEQWLADYFSVSRTPVREALLQLRAEGFVQTLPNRGFVVKPMLLEDAYTIFQTRAAIEGYCAAHLARNIDSPEALSTVQEINLLLKKVSKNFNREDEIDFHLEIIKFSKNPEFVNIFKNMRAKIDIYWTEVVNIENRPEEAQREHEVIMESILAGDDYGAFRASEDHLFTTYNMIKDSDLFKKK